MATCKDSSLLVRWLQALADAGIDSVNLLSSSEERDAFGDGEASFRWGSLVLRLVQDRGQEFVDIAPAHEPQERFRLDDIGIALGWRRAEEVVARTEPVPLLNELGQIVRWRNELESALTGKSLPATRVAINVAVAQRESAFLEKLRRLADQSR